MIAELFAGVLFFVKPLLRLTEITTLHKNDVLC